LPKALLRIQKQGGKKVKITIEIVIETHEENPPTVEVRQVETPESEERKQTTLEAFKHPSIGEELEKAFGRVYQGPKQIAKREHLVYPERNVHRCTRCNAPHRRMDKETGVCKEPTCETGEYLG